MPILDPAYLSVSVYLLDQDDTTFVKAALKLQRVPLNKMHKGAVIYCLEPDLKITLDALPKRANSSLIVVEEDNVIWATELLCHLNLKADNALTTAMTDKTAAVLHQHRTKLWVPDHFFHDLLAMTVAETR